MTEYIRYRVLARPNGYDTSLYDDEFDTIDEAVKWAISMTPSDDFLIVRVIDWSAKELL